MMVYGTYFKRLPSAVKNDSSIDIYVPAVVPFRADHRVAYVEYLSYEVVLMGSRMKDMAIDYLDILYSFETEIFKSRDGYPEKRITLDLEQLGGSENNFLMVGLRTKLLEDPASSAFSNSKEANPVGVLGVWNM